MRLVVSSADGLSHPLRLVASSGRRLVATFAVSSEGEQPERTTPRHSDRAASTDLGRRQTVGGWFAVSSEGTPFTV